MSYIDREKAIGLIDNYRKTVDENGKVVVNAIRDMFSVILPTKDSRTIKRGEWLIHERQAPKGRKIKYSTKQCSVCGKWNGRHATNYFPNCGAKMCGRMDLESGD